MLEAAWLPSCLAHLCTWLLVPGQVGMQLQSPRLQLPEVDHPALSGSWVLPPEPSRTKPAQQEARGQLRGWDCTVSMSARNFRVVWKWWHQQQASSASTSACGCCSSWYKEAANL